MKRSAYNELNNKIEQAKEAVTNDIIYILDPAVIAVDALELGYEVNDIAPVLSELLDDITPEHYVGTYPPQKSYEEDIRNSELFAFTITSKLFGCVVYVKYVLKEGTVWIVSLHQDRDKEERK